MLYEIINPSDAMTIEADDPKVAQAAILLLGEGKIGLTSETGEDVLPLLFFGGGDKWIEENFREPKLGEFIKQNREAIAKCLESVVYGSLSNRKAIMAAVSVVGPEKLREALAKYNDEKRTSLNDFSAYAHELADRLRNS